MATRQASKKSKKKRPPPSDSPITIGGGGGIVPKPVKVTFAKNVFSYRDGELLLKRHASLSHIVIVVDRVPGNPIPIPSGADIDIEVHFA